MALTGRQYSLQQGEFEATITEVGAGLRALRCRGVDITEHFGEDELPPRACGATLVPWPNRLRDGKYEFGATSYQLAINDQGTHTANHGLGRWHRWNATQQHRNEVDLALDLVPQPGYPFEIRVELTYRLTEDGLVVSGSATNTGAGRAPFGAGWHPYFSLRGHRLDDVTVTLPAAQRLDTDEQQIPVGRSPVQGTEHDFRAGRRLGSLRLDDGFSDLTGRTARISTPSGGAELWFDAAFGYLQCFTPDNWAHDRPAIAIEPMTCPADAFNNGWGLTVLEPGERWAGTWGIRPI